MGLIEAVCLASRFCGDSDAHNFPDNCQDMLHNRTRTVNMGYWWPNADKTPGKYTVEITSVKPYCQGEILTNEMATNRNTYITEDWILALKLIGITSVPLKRIVTCICF